MIIPIKCFTCGKVLADKWSHFNKKSAQFERSNNENVLTVEDINMDDSETKDNYFDRNKRGKLLDDLGLKKICCRRHMLGHVDLIDLI